MAGVRETVHDWWRAEGFGELSMAAQRRIALRLFQEDPTEEKFAGVLRLSETLLPDLSVKDLPAFGRLFTQGLISDWNLCDWFSVKVLGKTVEHADVPASLAKAISVWRWSTPIWQRRASCVAFVNHAKHGDTRIAGLSRIILTNGKVLVGDSERFAQTGVGWVLRELSVANRQLVDAFARDHLDDLSREGIRYIGEKMPKGEQKKLLALHAEPAKLRKKWRNR